MADAFDAAHCALEPRPASELVEQRGPLGVCVSDFVLDVASPTPNRNQYTPSVFASQPRNESALGSLDPRDLSSDLVVGLALGRIGRGPRSQIDVPHAKRFGSVSG